MSLEERVAELAKEFEATAERWQRIAGDWKRITDGDYALGAYDAYDIAAQKLRALLKEEA